MSKTVNFLSTKQSNILEGYERFAHTKEYLIKKSGPVNFYFKNQIKEIKRIAEKCGYKDFNQFIKHRKEKWHTLEGRIPLSYLNAIGAKIKTLKYTVNLDRKDFKNTLESRQFLPKYFTIRMNAAFYKTEIFKELFTEKEAVEYLKNYSAKNNKICWINYKPSIKTITVFPNGRIDRIFYKPGIVIKNKFAVPTLSGTDIGKIKIL